MAKSLWWSFWRYLPRLECSSNRPTITRQAKRQINKTRAGPGLLCCRNSLVLAHAGNQPRLVIALQALHAPAFAEGFTLIEARGLLDAAEGQGGDGLVGQVVEAIELYIEVVDVGRLEA